MKFIRSLAVFTAATSLIATPDTSKAGTDEFLGGVLGGIVGSIIVGGERADEKRDGGASQQNNVQPSQQQTQPSGPAVYEPAMSRATRRQVQQGLNQLGYNVGVVDGVIGRGSRRAISRYQSDRGYNANGYLTDAQIAELRSAAGPVASQNFAAQPAPPSRQLDRDEVRALQSSLRSLGHYRSSVDGVSGPGTRAAMESYLYSRNIDPSTVTPREALVMASQDTGQPLPPSTQLALSSSASGGGNYTQTAAADGQQQQGGGFSVQDFLKDASVDGGDETSGSAQTSGFSPANYQVTGRDSGFNLSLELSRRALAVRTDLLQSDDAVKTWVNLRFPQRGYGQGGSQSTEWTVKYWNGTAFDRKDAIRELRGIIQTSAVTSPMRFVLAQQATISPEQFDPAQGIPLSKNRYRGADTRGFSMPLQYLNNQAKFYFYGAPDISHIPGDEARARDLAALLKGNRNYEVQVRQYVSMTSIGDVVEGDGPNGALVANADLDAIDVVLLEKRQGQPTVETLLHRWDLLAQDKDDGLGDGGIEAYAAKLGIEMADGALVTRRAHDSFDQSDDQAWNKLHHYAHLGERPELLEDNNTLFYYAGFTLSDQDKHEIARGRPIWGRGQHVNTLSEFEAIEFYDELRQKYGAKILAMAPPLPTGIIEVTQVRLGKYDFNSNSFPLIYRSDRRRDGRAPAFASFNGKISHETLSPQVARSNFNSFPNQLSVPRNKAEALAGYLEQKAGKGKRYLYLAVFATLPKPVMSQGQLVFDFSVNRAALFADPKMKELMLELEVSDGWRTAAEVIPKAKDDIPLMSADTALLWYAQQRAELLDNRAFLALALNRRGRQEAIEDPTQLFGGPMLPDHLASASPRDATPRDWTSFRDVYPQLVEAADFSRVRLTGDLDIDLSGFENPVISLHDVVQAAYRGTDYRALRAAEQMHPTAYDVYSPVNDEAISVALALTSDVNWYQLEIDRTNDLTPDAELSFTVDLSVREVAMSADDNGRPVVVASVAPKTLIIQNGAREVARIDLDSSDDVARAASYDRFDILGVHLGMSLQDATDRLLAEAPEGAVTAPLLGETLNLDTGSEIAEVGDNGVAPVHFGMFTGGAREDTSQVIALSRVLELPEAIDPSLIYESLVEKFGEPDSQTPHGRGGLYVWYENDAARARLAAENAQNDCVTDPRRALRLPYRSNLASGGAASAFIDLERLTKPCGVYFVAATDPLGVTTLLVDTDAAMAFRDARTEAANAASAEADKKVKKKLVKF